MRGVFEPAGERPAELDLIRTAELVTNAIPKVREAETGFKTTLDLPITAAKFAI